MKVTPLSFKANTKVQQNKQIANKPEYNTRLINDLSSGVLGRSLITFKGADVLTPAIDESYFQLPAGAKPDKFQIESAIHLNNGEDDLVTVPTGKGKTATAHWIMTKNLKEGKQTFYTAPLKALSNQKFREFKEKYGEKNVGLLTGDVKINPEAPIVVMTTEIYRNMLLGEKFKHNDGMNTLNKKLTVVFDELQFLGDIERGSVWEQAIILSDKDTQLHSLSATIGNNQEITDWISSIRGKKCHLVNVAESERDVPLKFQINNIEPPKKKMKKGHGKVSGKVNAKHMEKTYLDVIKRLKNQDKIPAIMFIFSKKESNKVLKLYENEGIALTTTQQKKEIWDTIKRYQSDGKVLGSSFNIKALMKGYAIHNSGLLPDQKELIEELFQNKLIFNVIATETLGAGINMPARTVEIWSSRIPTSPLYADGTDGKVQITPNKFKQTSGRAGRRGIDTIGYVELMAKGKEEMSLFNKLIASVPDKLKCEFNEDYSFVSGYHKQTQDDDLIKELLSKSLYAYDKDPVVSEAKANQLLNKFNVKRNILKEQGFLNADNTLTVKGELLSKLNGYQQIPIVDMIFDKKLSALTPSELAACVGVMATADEKIAARIDKLSSGGKYEQAAKITLFEHQSTPLTWFIDEFDKYLDKYNVKMENAPNFQRIAQDKSIAKHLYAWADLNSKKENSKANWKNLVKGDLKTTIYDEGSLFKEINQTVDLLKQMRKIADAGLELAKNEKDILYHTELKTTIKETLNLLVRKPLQNII